MMETTTPQAGGSYIRDPKTGELTRVEENESTQTAPATTASVTTERKTNAATAPASKPAAARGARITDGTE